MTLTESNRNLISKAMAMAASRYVEMAADVELVSGGNILAQQFINQAVETRMVAALVGEAEFVSVTGVGDQSTAHCESLRITSEEIARVKIQRSLGDVRVGFGLGARR